MPDNLKQLRERIDALDLEILKLVSQRAIGRACHRQTQG